MFLKSTRRETRSDEELFLALRAKDEQALSTLWDRYAHLLFGVAMNYLHDREKSKDSVLTLFAELPNLAERHQVRMFRPWLHQVMRNRCLMSIRNAHEEVRMDGRLEVSEVNNEDHVLWEASLQRLEAALEQIDHVQRACLRSFYSDNLSYQRIAALHRLSVDQVRSHLQNGRRMLRKLLSATRNIEDHDLQ
jgi:RNA polymerase sigma-70 factor (ECF subfamily)